MQNNPNTSLSQLVYTSTCVAEMTPRLSHRISEKSVDVCWQLGLTGRVFANDVQAFAITEGQTELVRQYFDAVKNDKMVESILLHVDRPIETREFTDYSVWLNSAEIHLCGPHVKHLSEETLGQALPSDLSAKIRIMMEAYLKPEILANSEPNLIVSLRRLGYAWGQHKDLPHAKLPR